MESKVHRMVESYRLDKEPNERGTFHASVRESELKNKLIMNKNH